MVLVPELVLPPANESPQEGLLKLKAWMDDRVREMRKDKDCVLPFTGDERSGKSTIAFHMGLYMDRHYRPNRNVSFTATGHIRTSERLSKGAFCHLDEGIKGLFSHSTMSPDNKALAEYLTIAGEKNQVHALLWPNIQWLAKIIKEHRAKYNVHVVQRFDDKALAQMRELKDDRGRVYDEPRVLFPFYFPKAEGPLWDEYRLLKSTFVTQVGRGADDDETWARDDFLGNARERVRKLVAEIPSAGSEEE